MRKVTIKNNKLASVTFWESMNKLTKIEGLNGVDTVSLFRLKKLLSSEVDCIRDSINGNPDKEAINSVLQADYTFDLELDLELEGLAPQLNADDLFQLEPLFL